MTDLAFDLRWLARDAGDPSERASLAAVRIAADDVVFTELSDEIAQTLRAEAHLSVVHLGRWFATNWWRLRWEPSGRSTGWRLSHDLAGAGGGLLWPPLRFESDGETVEVTPVEAKTATGRRPPMVRYLASRSVTLPAASFESAVDRLMETLLARLDARGARDEELTELWRIVSDERSDPAQATFRRREALLGLDPDEVDQADLQRGFAAGAWMGSSAWDEVIAASPNVRLAEAAADLATWRSAQGPTLDLSTLQAAASAALQTQNGDVPWQRGSRLARALRGALSVGHAPLLNDELSGLLSVDVNRLPVPAVDTSALGRALSVGFRDLDRPEHLRTRFRSRHPRARRFELARIVGDALVAETEDTGLPVTGRATARQKVQRAFAQELLCPEEALVELPLPNPSEDDITELADRYDVSEWLIMSALQNHRLVPWDYFGSLGR